MPNQQDEGQGGSTLDDNHQQQVKPRAAFIKEETMHRGKWISMEKVTYQTSEGSQKTWESCKRVTHQDNAIPDVVAMVAVLKRLIHYDCVLLTKQFRPALKSYTIEFPAGMIDQGEIASDAAIRELKEETGYTATVQSVSPVLSLDAGMSSSTMSLVHMQIDGDDPVNMKPAPDLDDGKNIEVLLLPYHKLCHKLREIAARDNCIIQAEVYMYAATLEATTRALSPRKK